MQSGYLEKLFSSPVYYPKIKLHTLHDFFVKQEVSLSEKMLIWFNVIPSL